MMMMMCPTLFDCSTIINNSLLCLITEFSPEVSTTTFSIMASINEHLLLNHTIILKIMCFMTMHSMMH